jgi:hypothetical protein
MCAEACHANKHAICAAGCLSDTILVDMQLHTLSPATRVRLRPSREGLPTVLHQRLLCITHLALRQASQVNKQEVNSTILLSLRS